MVDSLNFDSGNSGVDLFKAFEPFSIQQSYGRGDFIYYQDEPPKGLFLIQKGLVGLKHVTASGHQHLMRLFKCHQVFGYISFLTGQNYNASAVALEPTQLSFITRDKAYQILDRDPKLWRVLAQIAAFDLRQCEMQKTFINENQVLARTAQALIFLKNFHPYHRWTRAEISEFIASTPTTVIKALAELERRGLIRQKGRQIEILDSEGLLNIPEDDVF